MGASEQRIRSNSWRSGQTSRSGSSQIRRAGFPGLRAQLRQRWHFLEQSSPYAPRDRADQRHGFMGQPVFTLLDVAGTVRHSLDGRCPFRFFTYRGVRRCIGPVFNFLHSAGAINHPMQRTKVQACARRWRGFEKCGVTIDVRVD